MDNIDYIEKMKGKLNTYKGRVVIEHLEFVSYSEINFDELDRKLYFVKEDMDRIYLIDCVITTKEFEKMLMYIEIYIEYGMEEYLKTLAHRVAEKITANSIEEYSEYFDFNARKTRSSIKQYNKSSRDLISSKYINVTVYPERNKCLLSSGALNINNIDILELEFNKKFVIIRSASDEKVYMARLDSKSNRWKEVSESELEYANDMGTVKVELPNFGTAEGRWQAINQYSRK